MKRIYGTRGFSQHPREAENLRMQDQVSVPWTTPTQVLLLYVSGPENCSFTALRSTSQFTCPILHLLFHFIPPTILPGKHYWPHITDEDIES